MSSRFYFPLPKKVAAPKSRWTLDQGVDIAAPAHTPLLAVGSGVIVRHGISGFGNDAPVLKLDPAYGGGYVYYGHAGPGGRLKDGTRVKAGQVIGEVGAGVVGISTGPHLEIGFARASGAPLGKQSAPSMRYLLEGGKGAGSDGISIPLISHPIGPAGPNLDPAKLPSDAEKAAQAGFTWGFNQLWDAVGGKAEYAGLFVLLLGVGAWAAVSGLKRATRSPQEATA